jgi:hypothetical protein
MQLPRSGEQDGAERDDGSHRRGDADQSSVRRAYARGWAEWWSHLIERDAGAMYVAVDLWSLAPWSQNSVALRRMLKKTCVLATASLFPELNPNSGNRFPPHLAIAVFGVPARKPTGVYHSHLLLRVPPAALGPYWTTLLIQDAGQRRMIEAPVAVASFVKTFRRLSAGGVSSVYVAHDQASRACAVDLALDLDRRRQRLEYLLEEGREVRNWDDALMEPFGTWRRVVRCYSTGTSAPLGATNSTIRDLNASLRVS